MNPRNQIGTVPQSGVSDRPIRQADHIHGRSQHNHRITLIHNTCTDGLRACLIRAGDHRCSLHKPGLFCRPLCHLSHHIRAGRRICHHGRFNKTGNHLFCQCSVFMVSRKVTELRQIIIHHKNICQFRRQISGRRAEFICFFVNLRLFILDPERFCENIFGTQRITPHLPDFFRSDAVLYLSELFLRSGIDPVEDRPAKRHTIFIHRDAVRSKRADSDTFYLLRSHFTHDEQISADPAEISPPYLFGVVLVIARFWILHIMRKAYLRMNLSLLVHQHSFT